MVEVKISNVSDGQWPHENCEICERGRALDAADEQKRYEVAKEEYRARLAASLDAQARAANPPISIGPIPRYYVLDGGASVSAERIDKAVAVLDKLDYDSEYPPEVFFNGDTWSWDLRRPTENPLLYLGDGTWISRSTIKEMIEKTGYLNVATDLSVDAEESDFDSVPEATFAQQVPPTYEAIPAAVGLEATLAERANRYGEFIDNAVIAQSLKEDLRSAEQWDYLPADVQEGLDLIVSKIARVLSGDAEYTDNWHDIQGYAKLIEDRINKGDK